MIWWSKPYIYIYIMRRGGHTSGPVTWGDRANRALVSAASASSASFSFTVSSNSFLSPATSSRMACSIPPLRSVNGAPRYVALTALRAVNATWRSSLKRKITHIVNFVFLIFWCFVYFVYFIFCILYILYIVLNLTVCSAFVIPHDMRHLEVGYPRRDVVWFSIVSLGLLG